MELDALMYGDPDSPTKKTGMATLRFLSVYSVRNEYYRFSMAVSIETKTW